MKKLFLLLLVLTGWWCEPAQAQLQGKARLDSLLAVLPSATADTQKIYLMAQISFSFNAINPDSGLLYGTMALNLARKINWEKGIGNSLYYRAANYLSKSAYPEALEDYLTALKFFESTGNKKGVAGTLSNIGNVYAYQLKNEKAKEYYLKALKINREISHKSSFEVVNIMNIGAILYNENNYKQALDYFNEAKGIAEEMEYNEMLADIHSSIGGNYVSLDEPFKAILNCRQAIEMATEMGNYNCVGISYSYVGTALVLALQKNDRQVLDSIYHGNKQEAIKATRTALDSAALVLSEIGNLDQLSEVYKIKAELLELEGNYKGALENFKLYKSTNDSVFNAEKNEKILQTALEYDFEKQTAAAAAEQEKKDIRQRNIRNSIMAGLAGSLLFLTIVYRQRNKIKEGKQRSDQLLLNILPEEVAEELKQKGSADAKQFDEVTVMFTDFKGFTQLTEKLSPTQLVHEIDTCFKAFDEIITRHHIEKIKTIGDSYMCVGGLPVTNTTHPLDVVQAALEIQQYMHEYSLKQKNAGKEAFEIRIGIHSGPVVAGIVGVKKFAYDIWGDTVNIASRMESSGEAGKVNISGSTYALVKNNFTCIHRGKIQAKHKGEIDMYFVEGTV